MPHAATHECRITSSDEEHTSARTHGIASSAPSCLCRCYAAVHRPAPPLAVHVRLLAAFFFGLGDGWLEFAHALDPRGKIGEWWFWDCVLLFPPSGIVLGFVLAYLLGQSRRFS